MAHMVELRLSAYRSHFGYLTPTVAVAIARLVAQDGFEAPMLGDQSDPRLTAALNWITSEAEIPDKVSHRRSGSRGYLFRVDGDQGAALLLAQIKAMSDGLLNAAPARPSPPHPPRYGQGVDREWFGRWQATLGRQPPAPDLPTSYREYQADTSLYEAWLVAEADAAAEAESEARGSQYYLPVVANRAANARRVAREAASDRKAARRRRDDGKSLGPGSDPEVVQGVPVEQGTPDNIPRLRV